jgi:hypothetical protein
MELKLFGDILDYLVSGGSSAIIVLLMSVILVMGIVCRVLVKTLQQYQQTISECHSKVVDAKEKEINSIKEVHTKYHDGTLATVQALGEIRMVLNSIDRSIK